MANICDFTLRISGRDSEKCQELASMFPIDSIRDNKNKYLKGRIYDAYIIEEYQEMLDNSVHHIEIGGECANSIYEIINKYPLYNLLIQTKKLELAVEIWGENNDIGSQEFCIINQGDFVLKQCVMTENYAVDEFEELTDEEKQEISDGFHLGISDVYKIEKWQEYLEDERYSFGGFGNEYGCFWFDIRDPQESLKRYENVFNA